MFTSGPSSPHLTIDQANNIFKLEAECQAPGVKLAKQFQVLSGLEAIHRNSIQGMAQETLTLGHSAWEAAYSAILQDGVSEAKHEATSHCLCSETDATWREMHELMYNHQLQYDQQLSTFLTDTKMTLNNMRGKIWATVRALAENEGIMFDACLGLTLQVFNLLPQIPLTIAYCLESSIYRRWCPEQGGFHLSTRKSGHPALCPKSWAGSPTNQVRGWIVPFLWLLLTTPQDQMGHGTPDVDPAAVPKVSLLPTASNQAWWAQQQVVIWSTPTLLKTARCWAASLNSPTMRETVPGNMTMPKKRAGSRH